MKKLKFTGFIVLTLIMFIQLMTASVAEERTTGSITLHKYYIENIENYTLRGDGTELSNDMIIGDGKRLDELDAMEDIPFRITRMELIAPEHEGSNLLEHYRPMTGGGGYINEELTDVDGIIVWDELEFGYYLIEELDNNISDTRIQPFIVQIPMTNPEGDGFLYDIHVYPKNMTTGPEVGKEIVPLDPETGSNVIRWKIFSDIPADIADALKYTITDVLDDRLEYIGNSLIAYYLDSVGNKVPFSGYTIDYDSTGNNTIVVTVTTAGFAELGNIISGDLSQDDKLYIEFDTLIKVTDPSDLGDLDNDAELNYTNSHGLEHTPKNPEIPPETTLYGIEIIKENTKKERLGGAKFVIYPSEADARAKTNALQDPNSATPIDWEVETDSLGVVELLGLQPGTYWLVETKAPVGGYNLLRDPVQVIVNDDDTAPYMAKITVENKKGFVLPTTGGEGTMLFTICGVILIGAAVLILALSIFIGGKKSKDEKVIKRRF